MSEIRIKSEAELEKMRVSGQLLARVFAMLDELIDVGVTTMQINDAVETFIVETLEARPASKGQYDYPYVLNTSINEVVCHGIPNPKRKLRKGEIVNVDITLEKNGYIADSSKMYGIGSLSPLAQRLVDTTYEAMWKGIRAVRPGATLGDVGHAIQSHAEGAGFSVVRDFCGHGIGREMHEEPEVLHIGKPGEGVILEAGMVFTIEPMINQGRYHVKTKRDGWTVITRDKKLSAQWEHTVAVTPDGVEVLTLREEERHRLEAGLEEGA